MLEVQVTVNQPLEKVWEVFNSDYHMKNWFFASPEWYVSQAENNFTEGGKIIIGMDSMDGSSAFKYEGSYRYIEYQQQVEYVLSDGRAVRTQFEQVDGGVLIQQKFQPENSVSEEVQRTGWQSILNQFKSYIEGLG